MEHDDGGVSSADKDLRVYVAESSTEGGGDDTSVQHHLPVGSRWKSSRYYDDCAAQAHEDDHERLPAQPVRQ